MEGPARSRVPHSVSRVLQIALLWGDSHSTQLGCGKCAAHCLEACSQIQVHSQPTTVTSRSPRPVSKASIFPLYFLHKHHLLAAAAMGGGGRHLPAIGRREPPGLLCRGVSARPVFLSCQLQGCKLVPYLSQGVCSCSLEST